MGSESTSNGLLPEGEVVADFIASISNMIAGRVRDIEIHSEQHQQFFRKVGLEPKSPHEVGEVRGRNSQTLRPKVPHM